MRATGFSLGKGTVRFTRLDAARLSTLRTLLRAIISQGITC
jgi:hypothetical protein